MDWMYLFYFLLAGLIFWGARYAGRGEWNEDYTSLKQTKILQGVAALGIALHHMSQKTCAPWHPSAFIVHGMDPFIPMGYMLVGVFLFCSGLGLYKSLKSKPDYLKGFFRHRVLRIVSTGCCSTRAGLRNGVVYIAETKATTALGMASSTEAGFPIWPLFAMSNGMAMSPIESVRYTTSFLWMRARTSQAMTTTSSPR